ncbi:transposase [Streptomyces sp. VTCC 41912]|uniref:transposase n=1 Tax=Streptomyces sp. VTCC 41912 TaxID=3383243 RepID=UPI003896EE5F
MADAGYGQNTAFRQSLSDRGLDFIVVEQADESAHPHQTVPRYVLRGPAKRAVGRLQARYDCVPCRRDDLGGGVTGPVSAAGDADEGSDYRPAWRDARHRAGGRSA